MDAILIGTFDFPEEDWSSVSAEAKDLVKQMLTYNYNTRISAQECLMHPWFSLTKDSSQPNPQTNKKILQKMKNFQSTSKLEKAVLLYIVSYFDLRQEKDEL